MTQPLVPADLVRPGHFVVGCNYWASHAGTAMWTDWRPDVVEEDLRQLAAAGLQVLRVFPLWPVFQPITLLRGFQGQPCEYRAGEDPLPDDEDGRAGVSPEAMQRFRFLADAAERSGLKLVVGLLAGWMSGRLFAPPALEGLNLLADPVALMWETRFVRRFVRVFRDHPAIVAWDLGNECNCLAPVPSQAAAWAWASAISNAIRAEDAARPVVSGMHDMLALWPPQALGELTDLLTTHPYPAFTPGCDFDPVDTIRTILHSTAESRLYADLGGRPCIAEELGTLGPILASEEVAAGFVRACLFSLWAHDCHGLLWWGAYDQLHLAHAPYDWSACERELGLIRHDRSAKPALHEMGQFRRFLERLPWPALPPRQTEAVCILTEGQDQWAVAYISFILAKQAGFDLAFQAASAPLKEADLYLMPSASGLAAIPRRRWLALLERVHAGATLYLSLDDALLSPFNEPLGLEVQTRARRPSGRARFSVEGIGDLVVPAAFRLELRLAGASAAGQEPDGNPAFTCAPYGQGRIYFLAVPLERALAGIPGAFHAAGALPFWRIYHHVALPHLRGRAVRKAWHEADPLVGLTEHPLDDDQRIIVAINYSPAPRVATLSLGHGWRPGESWYGERPIGDGAALCAAIPAHGAAVFTAVATHE